MKKLLFILMLIPSILCAQNCYTVKSVKSNVEIEGLNERRVTFGIKQMMEDVISDKYDLCVDGKPVEIIVQSIEAPQTGIQLGPWTKIKKVTIVTLIISMDDKIFEVVGKAKSTVESTFIDLNNEELEFSKTTFASAVKKAVEKSLR